MSKMVAITSTGPNSETWEAYRIKDTISLYEDEDTSLDTSDIMPVVTAPARLTAIEFCLAAGLLDTAEALLTKKEDSRFEPLQETRWTSRLSAAHGRLAAGRAYEAVHGVGSAYIPHHPLAIVTKLSIAAIQKISVR